LTPTTSKTQRKTKRREESLLILDAPVLHGTRAETCCSLDSLITTSEFTRSSLPEQKKDLEREGKKIEISNFS
jgi:hypothetical protein